MCATAWLTITHQEHMGIRGIAPGETAEARTGLVRLVDTRDFSRDGKKVLFEEEGEGGGPNYTVFLRDTDGSPPARIGEGRAEAISPDNKWVITQPLQEGLFACRANRGRRGPAIDAR